MNCSPSAPRAALWLAVASSMLQTAVPAAAAERTVVEEVLEILLEEGKIDDAKYRDLVERHRRERATGSTPAVSAPGEQDPEGWKAGWKNGLRVERNDGYHKLKLGGRIMNDWAVIKQDDGLVNKDSNSNWITGTEFRRARLFVSGTLFERMIFKAQYDFADGDPEFKDVYVGLTKLGPIDQVRVGHFKEPFGLEQLTSSKYITFMERSLPSVFDEARNTGIDIRKVAFGQRMTFTLAGFRQTDTFGRGFGNRDDYNINIRITGLPLYEEDGERLLHLGFGYSHGFREDATVIQAQRPEMHMADMLLNTGDITNVRGADMFGPELAGVYGPFSFQSEFSGLLFDRNQGGSDLWFWGAYAEASYWLTGEHRAYKKVSSIFDRVKPLHSFDPGDGHWGAFQAAVRYSYLDLNDAEINGGKEDNVTIGLNWHLFPNARVMLNYVYGRVRSQGDVNGAQTRFQIDF